MSQYDVFISYNWDDTPAVAAIVELLKGLDDSLEVFFDRAGGLDPGDEYRARLEATIKQSACVAIFFGPTGLGRFQNTEANVAQALWEQKQVKIIPVALPGHSLQRIEMRFTANTIGVEFRSASDLEAARSLVTGIMGRPPASQTGPPQSPVSGEDPKALLSRKLASAQRITYFFGPSAVRCGPNQDTPRDAITRRLLDELAVIEHGTQVVIPCDLAGVYYALGKSPDDLEDRTQELSAQLLPAFPQPHEAFARWLEKQAVRARAPRQFVVTTNVDLLLERAMLRVGVPFTRCVQHWYEPRLFVTRFARQSVAGVDQTGLDDIVRNTPYDEIEFEIGTRANADEHALSAFKSTDGVVLYKFLGSQDFRGSCGLTTEQHLSILVQRHVEWDVPKELQAGINDGIVVMIGYSPLDPEFRIIRWTFLKERPPSKGRRFIIKPPPDLKASNALQRLEARLWAKLKAAQLEERIDTIEEDPETCFPALVVPAPNV
jgi:hypothetical protein